MLFGWLRRLPTGPACHDVMVARREVLRTDRLVLTSWLPSDVDRLLEVHSDEETMRFVGGGHPETRTDTAALIVQYIAEDAELGVTKWRLADHHGHLIGRAGFGAYRDGWELGYTIRRERWGHGLATEIATGLLAWHRTHEPRVPLWALVAIGNDASSRVLQKAGFHCVGRELSHGVRCEVFRCPAGSCRP